MSDIPKPSISRALYRTFAVCFLVEILTIGLLLAIFRSWEVAIAISLGVLGPVSLWLGPGLYSSFQRSESERGMNPIKD